MVVEHAHENALQSQATTSSLVRVRHLDEVAE